MMWVNGLEQSSIPLTDRGLTLGDGFFTNLDQGVLVDCPGQGK